MTTTIDAPNLNKTIGTADNCCDKITHLWREADVHEHYPASTGTVVELLRSGGGFDASIELLENWCRSGMVPGILIRDGRFGWTAQHILAAAIHCDTWRRWIPCDVRHVHKMSAVELEEAHAVAEGTTCFTDLQTFDLVAFIEILARCNDPDMRGTFAVALKTKLRQLGVLDQ